MKQTLVSSEISAELIIKKSKFLAYLYAVKNEDEVKTILQKKQNEFSDSTHICYAYLVENKEKCYDDNEPSGTAGLPMLNVLKQNNLVNTLAIVVRYYGGVKLGAGGLVRAYSKSVVEALKQTKLTPYKELEEYEFFVSYEEVGILDKLANEAIFETIKKEFLEEVKVTVLLEKEKLELFKNSLNHLLHRVVVLNRVTKE